jgi:hypothetical protein
MAENKPQPPKMHYQDRADLFETFADAVGPWSFDGNTLRIEFLVTRMDAPKKDEPRSGRQFPVCRLALTANGAVELLNHCLQLTAALEKSGLLKKSTPPPPAKEVN